MLTGIILVIIFLSVLILLHEAGHFWSAKKFGVHVEEFGIGLPPRLFGKKIKETIYSVNALPVGGFVKILGEGGENSEGEKKSILDISLWKRAVILSAGVFMNFIFGWLLLSVVMTMGNGKSLAVAEVAAGSPAADAGIAPGNRILSVSADEETLKEELSASQFVEFVSRHRGEELDLKIVTGSETVEISVYPRENPPEGQGALGVAVMDVGSNPIPFPQNIWQGFVSSVYTIKEVYVSIFRMVIGVFQGESPLNQVTGPIGIVKTATSSQALGWYYVLALLSLISLNLSALNFFPFPALDGGRIIFLVIEKIKGSPVPKEIENYVNAAGMILLLLFMLIVSVKDILAMI